MEEDEAVEEEEALEESKSGSKSSKCVREGAGGRVMGIGREEKARSSSNSNSSAAAAAETARAGPMGFDELFFALALPARPSVVLPGLRWKVGVDWLGAAPPASGHSAVAQPGRVER